MPSNEEDVLREKIQAALRQGHGKLRLKELGQELVKRILRFQEKERLRTREAASRLGLKVGQ